MRIILVADHASIDFGGEAALPCHYFRVLLERESDVHLVVHERSKHFLARQFHDSLDRVHYVKDSAVHRLLFRMCMLPPRQLSSMIFGFLLGLLTQFYQRKIVKLLIKDEPSSVVHQVIPVSPKAPSLIFGLGAPVIIGPMNGGMQYPRGFSGYYSRVSQAVDRVGRAFSHFVNLLIPGKLKADALLVANDRTKAALPMFIRGEVITLVENGVDLSIWEQTGTSAKESSQVPVFVYVGRLVDWKAVDILLDSFFLASESFGDKIQLLIIGDGVERKSLEMRCGENNNSLAEVHFMGWLPQSEISKILVESRALVLSSLYECGGAVVLEAMASAIPVIATDWGGPADYLDESCGILISPESRTTLVEGFSNGILQLSKNRELANQLGKKGREKIERDYDWALKVDVVESIYKRVLDH